MKFFKKPPIRSVRKRFAWLPVKQCIMHGMYVAHPDDKKLIPFEPGWHEKNNYPTSRAKPMFAKSEHCGGMVHPVQWRTATVYDHWVWLDWVVEELTADHDDSPSTYWRPYYLPKQWSIFHEYD